MNNELHQRLLHFLEAIPTDTISQQVAAEIDHNVDDIRNLIITYINEANVTLDLAKGYLRKDIPILEVGAGLCLLSLFLKQEGYSVTALEPALGGYALFEHTKNAILQHFASIDITVLDCAAQELNPERHGRFKFIYSNNVMEHIPAWKDALVAMAGVLESDGVMVHSCPNYTFPYEPHYGVPVLRRLPGLSRWFLAGSHDMEIWDSLNFISASQVSKFGNNNHYKVTLAPGLLYKAFARLENDDLFSARHGKLLGWLGKIVTRTKIGKLIEMIPANMVTPMIFEIRFQTSPAEENM